MLFVRLCTSSSTCALGRIGFHGLVGHVSPSLSRSLSLCAIQFQKEFDEKAFEKYKDSATKPLDHFKKPAGEISEVEKPRIVKVLATEVTNKLMHDAKEKNDQDYLLPHPIWSDKEVKSVEITHRSPDGVSDKAAYYCVMLLRKSFDLASGYTIGNHFKMLDERMHLMTFMQLRRPGPIFRGTVILTQWLFTFTFSFAYMLSPNFCHRFVGYLEEQAVVTYTHILEEIDAGRLPMWKTLPAPELAIKYWRLPEDAKMREVILAIRADEAHHRLVNHTLGSMDLKSDNPFEKGK
ncbi:hypothetical protein TCAL_06082 [Tigriopus californicus]|uniref:Alternative oxidase n=1 Tax=Tigriopus californicus TaxID=6832 RepID=A0A553P4S0_TIGCA|nr:hypothetical protein TCAL_06082 [Tigriopus californicus]